MKPLLLMLGWYRPGTGFTRVLHTLAPLLAARYRIRWHGVGYRDAPLTLGSDIELVPTNTRGGDILGAYSLAQELPALRPGAILVLNDIWHLAHYARVLAPQRGGARMIGYFPLDGRPLSGDVVTPLQAFDALATFTHTARDAISAVWPQQLARPPLGVIGHGVDTGRFAPAPELRGSDFDPATRIAARRAVFPAAADDPAPFWVLNASRPDPRKRLDLTLEGFARFAADKPPGVRLCLHQALAAPTVAGDLRDRAAGLGIERRLLFDDAAGPLSDAGLNTLYNACDVGVNTAAGEGFGLVSFEHAAAGAAQVVPDHPALAELWGECALRVPLARRYVPTFSPLEMADVSPRALASELERLYREPAHLRAMSRAACAHARAPRWRWPPVASALLGLLAAPA